MRFSTFFAAFALTSAAEVKVDVYEKPDTCEHTVKAGDFLKMHYTGTIDESSATGEKGKKFDSSRDRGSTFDFKIGAGQVIKGWDEGIVGLCVGSKAVLTIPPEMGYGEGGAGDDIPGGATLKFDIEVVGLGEAPAEPNIFKDIDTDGDLKLTKEEVQAWFKKEQGQEKLPDGLWEAEDKDQNGHVSWAEFSGPKGDNPHEEL